MKIPPTKFTFREKEYTVRSKWVSKEDDGSCSPPKHKIRYIDICPSTNGKKLLDTLIHEGIHATLWDLDEEAVVEVARDITNLLWKLGYRKIK